jgi:hypothetical protein
LIASEAGEFRVFRKLIKCGAQTDLAQGGPGVATGASTVGRCPVSVLEH